MYACAAGRVAANQGWSSNFTNRVIRGGLIQNGASKKQCDESMENIRQDLAKSHATALSGATPNSPIKLTASDISAFHHDVFSNYYGGRYMVFGGDVPGNQALLTVTGWFGLSGGNWCADPGCW